MTFSEYALKLLDLANRRPYARTCPPRAGSRSATLRGLAALESCQPGIALRSLDAIHLAGAAESASWPLCTNDARMRAAVERMGYPLTPLPK